MYDYGYSMGTAAGVSFATTAIISIAAYVVVVIAFWRIFTKAGEAGWKSIIPIYNGYVIYKIAWNTKMFFITLALGIVYGIFYALGLSMIIGGSSAGIAVLLIGFACAIAMFVLAIMFYHKLSVAFGHGGGFTVGLVLLNVIFILILGFGSSQYVRYKGQSEEQPPTYRSTM